MFFSFSQKSPFRRRIPRKASFPVGFGNGNRNLPMRDKEGGFSEWPRTGFYFLLALPDLPFRKEKYGVDGFSRI
jgi:hypothetical protein